MGANSVVVIVVGRHRLVPPFSSNLFSNLQSPESGSSPSFHHSFNPLLAPSFNPWQPTICSASSTSEVKCLKQKAKKTRKSQRKWVEKKTRKRPKNKKYKNKKEKNQLNWDAAPQYISRCLFNWEESFAAKDRNYLYSVWLAGPWSSCWTFDAGQSLTRASASFQGISITISRLKLNLWNILISGFSWGFFPASVLNKRSCYGKLY